MLRSADVLMGLARQHYAGIMELLGYELAPEAGLE
jgi:hypothetical protein